MPLYEYECEACGHRFEVIQKFSDPPVEQCAACGGKVKKLLSSPAIQFKGSGWYITDYARKEPSASSGSGAGSDAGSDKKGSDSGSADSSSSSGASKDTSNKS